ncbi:MAG: helix-turn-helix transcriptional regulator [Pseudomonadota bacterium]
MDDFSDRAATFGDRMALAREAQGLSQGQLARHLGLKVESVRNWEADRAEPRANRLQMLAAFLNVSMIWLLTGRGDGAPNLEHETLGTAPGDLTGILAEMRVIRQKQARLAEEMGRLEKRLAALASA